jgi:phosphatidate phosphatase APP1
MTTSVRYWTRMTWGCKPSLSTVTAEHAHPRRCPVSLRAQLYLSIPTESCGRPLGWMRSPFHHRSPAHSSPSILRFLFPRTRARARARLSKLRHETVPALKRRTQSRIYRYLVARQAAKLSNKSTILQRLRSQTRRLLGGSSSLENAIRLRRVDIAKSSNNHNSSKKGMSYQDNNAPREAGGRRRKLAGYFKAANELRQTYTQQYASSWANRESNFDYEDEAPGSFSDAAIVRSGDEEMILFPSYARPHVKKKPEPMPEVHDNDRDTSGAGDAEFWKQQWNAYEDDNATVDVDVRGWIYSPHKGQMSRKQRLFVGLARQLVGVPAPAVASVSSGSSGNSRDTSPTRHGFRERAHLRQAQYDETATAKEAEEILRRGEREAAAAAKGAYSEKPSTAIKDDTQLYRTQSSESLRTSSTTKSHQLSHQQSNNSLQSVEGYTPLQKRASWNQPADMNSSELAEANARLMSRLRHFLAMPMANTAISVFFYNSTISKQRTVYTDAAGHFSITAALDFVPTHVRILASEQLSATEEVIVTDSRGISVISDIDDTIKHSAISSGAREIFRNVFIRDLGDLTIDGVREWYNKMAEKGVKFHYVSNSPWQLFPVISAYFSMAGLPQGSFHLKQYSGMLQGIFEPVAERKKVTLDKIARDFPERRFMLIGDSGEADLEVYTDFVLENPGRVAAVFIRDVTTSPESGNFFDPSVSHASEDRYSSPSSRHGGNINASATSGSHALSDEHDPELKAAIAASLREFEEEDRQRSRPLLPSDRAQPEQRPGLPPRNATQKAEPVPNLIDLTSDDETTKPPAPRRVNTDTKVENEHNRPSNASNISIRSAPPPPKKPTALRSTSGDSVSVSSQSASRPPPPPKPRQSSTATKQDVLSSQDGRPSNSSLTISSKPSVPPKPNFESKPQQQYQPGYADMARDKLYSVYNSLPAWNPQDDTNSQSSTPEQSSGRRAPPPPPPRRGTAANAASYVGNKASSAWQHAPTIHGRSQVTSSQTSQPSSVPRERLNRTNTGSTLGLNGGGGAGYDGPYINKKEQLWRQRWARAEKILGEKGVVLRSWRVGSDAVAEAMKVIDKSEKFNLERGTNERRDRPGRGDQGR